MYFDHRVSRNGCNLQSVSSNIPDRRRATFEEIVFFSRENMGTHPPKIRWKNVLGKIISTQRWGYVKGIVSEIWF